MNQSFRPQVEKLEDRMAMDAAGTSAIYQTITLTDNTVGQVNKSSQPVSGRLTSIAADPSSDVDLYRDGPGVLKSIDGGQTWASRGSGDPLPVLLVIANRD